MTQSGRRSGLRGGTAWPAWSRRGPRRGRPRRGAASPFWMKPLEAVSAALMLNITVLLLVGVISRYVFGKPIVWSDEVVSISFVWLRAGSAIAVYRNEHLRLNLFVEMLPTRPREFVHAFALVAVAAVLVALVGPAIDYTRDEWFIRTPALDMPKPSGWARSPSASPPCSR